MVAGIISGPRLLMTALLSTFFFLRIMKRWNNLSPLIFTEHYSTQQIILPAINITPANKLFSKLRGMKFQVGDIHLSVLLTLSSS